jgi:pseudouridine-5'-phosphate glycosidase
MTGLPSRLVVTPEVASAVVEGRAVVALESTLISHGLPYPSNVDVARAAEAAVREAGAVPATIAIRDGRVLVGLADEDLEGLATAMGVLKAARPNLAIALWAGGWAATTVSATMIAASAAGIRVFATGGIGGVHRAHAGEGASWDVSSDLEELARTPMVVVCSGPKSILDVPATIEVLETRGVPVVVIGSDEVPGFTARGSGVRASVRAETAGGAAGLARVHLELGLGSAMLVCVPVPTDVALGDEEARAAGEQATEEAEAAGVRGPDLTPWLLARIAALTEGRSVRANTALVVNNAAVAAQIAALLAPASQQSGDS